MANPWVDSHVFAFDFGAIEALVRHDDDGAALAIDVCLLDYLRAGEVPPSALAPITGTVAESLAEVLLADLGFLPIWHLEKAGLTGVDLVLLDPLGSSLVALEVKGTARTSGWPRLTRGRRDQMTKDWLAAPNAGMEEWALDSHDLRGMAIAISLAQCKWKVAVTSTFSSWVGIQELQQLEDLSWLPETNAGSA